MDLDDDPSPVDLEQLLPLPSEDDSENILQYEEVNREFLSSKFTELLAAVPKDDPCMRHTSCKPCLPRLESKYKCSYESRTFCAPFNKFDTTGELFTVQAIPGKGMGVIASRRIPRGSIILCDPFIISIQEPTEDPFPQYETNGLLSQMLYQLLEQYLQLPLDKREQFASLHPYIPDPGCREWFREQLQQHAGVELKGSNKEDNSHLDFLVRIYYTFNTNEFSKKEPGRGGVVWTVRRLFPVTARINHSCCPNSRSRQTTDGYKVVTAMRDIEKGEEVLLKYLDHVRFSREGWQATTQRTWGFVCDCDGCSSKTEQI